MKYHLAHTVPINPLEATPKLTRAQVWEGLKLKARDPLRYVPAIAKCEVIEEHANGMTRVVEFKPNMGPPGKITEVITYEGDCRADFQMVDHGNFISNIISNGSGESDLYLTFSFSWNFPEIQEGTSEATEKIQQVTKMAEASTTTSVNEIRDLVQKGTIKA